MSAPARSAAPALDTARVKADFPILAQQVRGRPIVYLDTAASAQKPRAVIDAVSRFYERDYANIHRSVYQLAERATRAHDAARARVASFLNAAAPEEVIFVRNATEAINLVAASWGRGNVGAGDEVVITALEHHANLVPWQQLCLERGARLRVVPVSDAGEVDLDAYRALLNDRTRIVAAAHVSNAIGTVVPVRDVVRAARERGIPVLLDGAQAVPRFPVDLQELGCDFYAFSGHKLYGPSGVGVLWGRAELLRAMPPYQTGGSMIASVSFEKTTFADIPHRFEAGTPDIAGAVGLHAAIDYLEALGMDRVAAHEADLAAYGARVLEKVEGLRLIGAGARDRTGVLSFVVDGVHPHDLGTLLDGEGVCIRAGHHCAQPLMERYGVAATARASVGIYNERSDLDRLADAVRKAIGIFR